MTTDNILYYGLICWFLVFFLFSLHCYKISAGHVTYIIIIIPGRRNASVYTRRQYMRAHNITEANTITAGLMEPMNCEQLYCKLDAYDSVIFSIVVKANYYRKNDPFTVRRPPVRRPIRRRVHVRRSVYHVRFTRTTCALHV